MKTLLQNLKLHEIIDPMKVCDYFTINKIMEGVCAASTTVYLRYFHHLFRFFMKVIPRTVLLKNTLRAKDSKVIYTLFYVYCIRILQSIRVSIQNAWALVDLKREMAEISTITR